jgi:hypothetical protein
MPAKKPSFAKFGDKKRDAYLQALRDGNHRYTSARSVGVSAELVRLYRKEFPAFAEEEQQAEAEACGRVEDALFQAALTGNVTACQVWLYNRAPERWKDQRNLKLSMSDDDINRAIDQELARLTGAGEVASAGPPQGNADANGRLH